MGKYLLNGSVQVVRGGHGPHTCHAKDARQQQRRGLVSAHCEALPLLTTKFSLRSLQP